MTSTFSAPEPAKRSALFNVLIVSVLLTVLASIAWGFLTDQQPVAPLLKAIALPVDSAWYQTLPMDPQAAADKYIERIPPALRARNSAFGHGSNLATALYVIRNLAAMLLLMFSGAVTRIARLVSRISSREPVQRALVIAFVFLVFWSFAFPLATYQKWILPYRAGPMYGTYSETLSMILVGILAGASFMAVALTVLYALARGSTKRGLLVLMSASSLWMTLGIVGQPYLDQYVDEAVPFPVADNDFMQEKVRKFAEESGVPVSALWLQNVNEQDGDYDAGTSGVGPAAHILLDDDMFRNLTLDEIKYVLGHEIGHFKRHHAFIGLLSFMLFTCAAILLTALIAERLLVRFRAQWRVNHLTDIGALPLVWGAYALIQAAAIPLNNTISRYQESVADQYALELTRRPDVMADFLMRGGEMTDAHPSAFMEFVFWDHPSLYSRVLAAMRWRAEAH